LGLNASYTVIVGISQQIQKSDVLLNEMADLSMSATST
jgi:hypothetical protein